MVEVQNYISAEELFGAACRLVAQSGEGVLSGIASLGVAYQVATCVLALLGVFIFMNYYAPVGHIVVSSISNKGYSMDTNVYSSAVNNIEIVLGAMGVLLISLLVMRLSVVRELQPLLAPLLHLPPWVLGCVVFGMFAAFVLGERLMLYIVGAVSEYGNFCTTIWSLKKLHFCTIVVLILPISILVLLTEAMPARVALFTSVAVCSIMLILFIKDSFLLFRAQRFSIFHWILYLCTLEIFPLSLLLAPIVRG